MYQDTRVRDIRDLKAGVSTVIGVKTYKKLSLISDIFYYDALRRLLLEW